MGVPTEPERETPPPITVTNVWKLNADPGRISTAVTGWQAVAKAARQAQATVDTPAGKLVGDAWSGDASDTYHDHLRRFGADVTDTATAADNVAGALDGAYQALRNAQDHLDNSFATVARIVAYSLVGDMVSFYPLDDAGVKAVNAAAREAAEIRADLDSALSGAVGTIEKQRPPLATISKTWESMALGYTDDWHVPPEVDGTHLIYTDDGVIVSGGSGDDKISVSIDPATGLQVVTVNGVRYYLPAGEHITIRGGGGDDTIEVAPGTKLNLTLLGGTGDDTITGGDGNDIILGLGGTDTIKSRGGNDRVSGGAGRDYIDGGTGDDILSGGMGDDTVYGMDGNDRISGGEGKDYLEGAVGNDTIDGDAGDDMISGGRGDDTISGDAGSDKIYTGQGTDTVDGGSGDDTAFSQQDDKLTGTEQNVTVELKDLGKYFKIEGSPEFVARVQADLDMLASSPRGQMMLAALDSAHDQTKAIAADWPVLGGISYQGDTFTIKEITEQNGHAHSNEITFIKTWSQHPSIEYNPSYNNSFDGPPVVVLYHEMAHVYDYEYGTLAQGTYTGTDNPDVPNREREAVGLPIDDDGDPSTPNRVDPNHPYDYTENGLRDEMGAPLRPTY
jgi:Ca2+-binding RTX toxin-like protein